MSRRACARAALRSAAGSAGPSRKWRSRAWSFANLGLTVGSRSLATTVTPFVLRVSGEAALCGLVLIERWWSMMQSSLLCVLFPLMTGSLIMPGCDGTPGPALANEPTTTSAARPTNLAPPVKTRQRSGDALRSGRLPAASPRRMAPARKSFSLPARPQITPAATPPRKRRPSPLRDALPPADRAPRSTPAIPAGSEQPAPKPPARPPQLEPSSPSEEKAPKPKRRRRPLRLRRPAPRSACAMLQQGTSWQERGTTLAARAAAKKQRIPLPRGRAA